MQLAPIVQTATLINGVWEIDYQSQRDTTIITRLVITGPSGSSVKIYIDNTLVDASFRGDLNSNELIQPYTMHPGQTLRIVWSLGTGNPATATIFASTGITGIYS